MLRLFLGMIIGIYSSISVASSVVLFPQTNAAAPSAPPQPGQTFRLQPVPRVQPNPWFAFFDNLRACNPGTYSLPQIDPNATAVSGNLVIQQIMGMNKDTCQVITTLQDTPGNPDRVTNKARMECNFTKETIELLISHYTNLIQGTVGNSADEDLYNKQIGKECGSQSAVPANQSTP